MTTIFNAIVWEKILLNAQGPNALDVNLILHGIIVYTYACICIYTTMCMHFPSDHPIISCLFKTTKLKKAIMLVKRSIGEKACCAMGLF